jgi:NTP pyrophosphatase (non-canonical NTP hydrolase)
MEKKQSMNVYTDLCLKNDRWIIQKVQDENVKQLKKWGIQTATAFEWMTYLTEEVGELAQAISEYEYGRVGGLSDSVSEEAIQVATLALKIAEMFEI